MRINNGNQLKLEFERPVEAVVTPYHLIHYPKHEKTRPWHLQQEDVLCADYPWRKKEDFLLDQQQAQPMEKHLNSANEKPSSP